MGYVSEESDHDESHEADRDDAYNSSHLLDLEAADSGDEVSSADGNSSDGDGSFLRPESRELHFFPQFKRLPIEIRQRIWEFFCPDLTDKSRVFWLRCMPKGSSKAKLTAQICEGPVIEQQTRPARTMLAVHSESRRLALRVFPDFLSIRGGIVRFNAARDVVYLDSIDATLREAQVMPELPHFTEHIRHLAVDHFDLSTSFAQESEASPLFAAFKNLKTLYYLRDSADHKPEHLDWCTSNLVRRYQVVTFEEQPGLGEDSQYLFCWPDVEKHRAFAENCIPVDLLTRPLPTPSKGILPDGVEAWPMVLFLKFDTEADWFERHLGWDSGEDAHADWRSEEEEDEDNDDEPDEYESEGIDDSEISEDDSDRDSDLAVLDGDESLTIHLAGDDNQGQPQFSSPDQSSSTAHEPVGSGSDQLVPSRSRLKRSRRMIMKSDSEHDSEGSPPQKRTRIGSRQNRIEFSEDEDRDGDGDEEKPRIRAVRRVRAVLSEDGEREDDGQEDSENDDDGPQLHDAGAEWSGFSSSGDESAGSPSIARPLTLAEKLQLHREEVQIVESDDGNSDIEETGADDYDVQDYANFQDDEEGIEISEGESERDELIMDDYDEGYEDYEY